MSEFGFQSFPDIQTVRKFAEPQDLDIISPVMQAHQKNAGGNERIRTYMLREYHEPRDFESFLYVSQVLQAEAIKVGAEHLRRQRPRTMDSLYWQLNDCWPVAPWASIGSWRLASMAGRSFCGEIGRVKTWGVEKRPKATRTWVKRVPKRPDIKILAPPTWLATRPGHCHPPAD